MKDPFGHFASFDLLICILRATLQAALLPMHRFMDEILDQLQEEEEEEEDEW